MSELKAWDQIMEYISETELFHLYIEQNSLMDDFKWMMLFADKDQVLNLISDFNKEVTA